MTRVVVLMSTYQGERFVVEQLQSILEQLPEHGRILVRDDGSSDGTVQAIEGIRDSRIAIIGGENVGFASSFLTLIDAAPADADMYMLSDQDDVWLPGKIRRAADFLAKIAPATPALYCSRLRLVNARLEPIGLSPRGPAQPAFETALTENIVVGCTAAFNRAALDLARRHGDTSRIYFHDWWLYLITAAFGVVHFDPEPTALYRQHGNNVIGMGSGVARYRTIARFLGRANFARIMYGQIDHLRDIYESELTSRQKAYMSRYFDSRSVFSTLRLVLSTNRHKLRILDEIMFRALMAYLAVTRAVRKNGKRTAKRSKVSGTYF